MGRIVIVTVTVWLAASAAHAMTMDEVKPFLPTSGEQVDKLAE